MHKLFSAIAISTILAIGSASAAPPTEVVVTDIVKMQPGESRAYEFAESFKRIDVSVQGIAEVIPQTDRAFTVHGLAPGQALVVAQSDEGHIIHRMLVDVAYAGTLIKIYKPTRPGEDDKLGYTSYQCTPHNGCGRPNPDLKRDQLVETEETKPTAGGGSVTTRSRGYQ